MLKLDCFVPVYSFDQDGDGAAQQSESRDQQESGNADANNTSRQENLIMRNLTSEISKSGEHDAGDLSAFIQTSFSPR